MTVLRMDNIGIVVNDMDGAIDFFVVLCYVRSREGFLVGLAQELGGSK